MGEGNKQYRSFRMCLNLNDYQYKSSRYNYGSTYMNHIVTTNQKHTITTHTKTQRKELKHTKEENN